MRSLGVHKAVLDVLRNILGGSSGSLLSRRPSRLSLIEAVCLWNPACFLFSLFLLFPYRELRMDHLPLWLHVASFLLLFAVPAAKIREPSLNIWSFFYSTAVAVSFSCLVSFFLSSLKLHLPLFVGGSCCVCKRIQSPLSGYSSRARQSGACSLIARSTD